MQYVVKGYFLPFFILCRANRLLQDLLGTLLVVIAKVDH